MTTHVALGLLTPGHAIDSRATGRTDGLKELAASIASHGLLMPLAVRPLGGDGVFQVVDGNRRLAALQMLAEKNKLSADHAVPVNEVAADDAAAREASLAANIVRLALHPVDEYEAFAALAAGGEAPRQIAKRFGVSEKTVKQRMALGGLHPDLREAWRAGKLDDEDAKAFTLCPDQARQKVVYDDLKAQHSLYALQIRMCLGADQDAASALRTIGVEAYKAAGGEIVEDLFGNSHVIADPELAKRLAADALQAECDRLKGEGWSFAIPPSVRDRWRWTTLDLTEEGAAPDEKWRLREIEDATDDLDCRNQSGEIDNDAYAAEVDQLETERDAIHDAIKTRGFPAKVKATAGCLVSPNFRGPGFSVSFVRRPDDAKASAEDPVDHGGEAGGAGAEPKPTISAALTASLSQQLTAAAARALAQDDGLALRMAVAALEADDPYNSPLKLRGDGMPDAIADAGDGWRHAYADILGELESLSNAAVLGRLVTAIARSLDLRAHSEARLRSKTTDALLARLDVTTFENKARSVFDAQGYFERITGAQRDAALEEMGVEKKDRPKKKAEAVALCKSKALASGWLPRELRHPADLHEGGEHHEFPGESNA